jgi:hypothetical protein
VCTVCAVRTDAEEPWVEGEVIPGLADSCKWGDAGATCFSSSVRSPCETALVPGAVAVVGDATGPLDRPLRVGRTTGVDFRGPINGGLGADWGVGGVGDTGTSAGLGFVHISFPTTSISPSATLVFVNRISSRCASSISSSRGIGSRPCHFSSAKVESIVIS